ncbi:MAG: hypothetical protein ABIR96_05430, partial [Bdellovibrionota bacterium]
PLKAGAIYLKMFYGENDGIILTAAQQPENFGTSLGTFEGDHKSLLNFSKSDNDSYSTQKTFARALLRFLLK